ncbi:MAG: hypothetical protein ACRDYX_02100 [Egibacteraceae bacterium]
MRLAVEISQMLTSRQFWLLVHLGAGAVFIHAFAGGLATLLPRGTGADSPSHRRTRSPTIRRIKDVVRATSTAGMALVAWITVLSGTLMVLPGYRASPPPGAATTAYPKAWLLASQSLSVWHNYGAEWKEHMGWLMPFLATAVAFIALRRPRCLDEDERLRKTVTTCFVLAFAIALVSGLLGAILNNVAPNQFLDL